MGFSDILDVSFLRMASAAVLKKDSLYVDIIA
jgi:hypothetical protein